MIHPDSKILAEVLIHPLTAEQRVCIVRVCNFLNDYQTTVNDAFMDAKGDALDRGL